MAGEIVSGIHYAKLMKGRRRRLWHVSPEVLSSIQN